MAMEQQSKRPRRKRRQHSAEFKEGAVKLVIDENRSAASVAEALGVHSSLVAQWVRQAKADRGIGRRGVLTTAEREELDRLRKENRELRIEREILKKATALFARERK